MIHCQCHATETCAHNTASYHEHRESHLRLFCAGFKAVAVEDNEEELTGEGVGLVTVEELVLEDRLLM